MLFIVDSSNNVIQNFGTNTAFPDGNIPNLPELPEGQRYTRCHDNSEYAQQIMNATEYSITEKLVETKDEEGNVIDSYYVVDTVTITKTKEQYQQEYEQSSEYRRQQILAELSELDKIITRQVEQVYIDTNTTPAYQPMIDTIAQKELLRQELALLEV